MKKLRLNIAINITGQLVTIVINLIAYKYIYSGLGGDALGIIIFSAMLGSLLVSVIDSGISKTTVKEIAQNYNSDIQHVIATTRLFSSIYWLAYLITISIFYVLCEDILTSWINIKDLQNDTSLELLLVLGVSSFLVLPNGLYAGICMGLQRFEINNSIDVLVNIIQQIGIILLIRSGNEILAIGYWIAISNIFKTLSYIVVVSRIYSVKGILFGLSIAPVIKIKKYTGMMAFLSFLLLVQKNLDKILISKFMLVSLVGFYGVAFNSVNKFSFITGAVMQVLFPSFSKIEREGKKRKLFQLFWLAQESLPILMLPIFMMVPFFSNQLFVFIFDEKTAKLLQTPVILLSIAFYLKSSIRPVSVYLTAIGRPGYLIKANILSILILTPVTWLLIEKYQLIGAAASWVLYFLLTIVYVLPRVCALEFGEGSFRRWLILILRPVIVGFFTILPCWLLSVGMFEGQEVRIAILYLISCTLYLIVVLNISDIKIIKRFKNLIRRV